MEIAAKAPDKRATIILFKAETGRGDQIRTYDGTTGWVRTPLNVLGEFQLVGGDLDGARFDAQLSFPGQIKQILTNLKTGEPTTISDLPMSHSQWRAGGDPEGRDAGKECQRRCCTGNRAEGPSRNLILRQADRLAFA